MAAVDQPLPATQAKLSTGTKIGYGVGDISAAIAAQVTGFFLTAFLLDVAGLRPGAISIILLVSNLWDAVTDPYIGNLSDRTKTRWGRRRPWLLFGAVPFGLAFLAQWYVPPLNDTGLFFYYLLAAILLKTAFTVVNVPYTSMTPELTDDYDERTSLTSFRFGFSILGGLAAVLLFPTVRDLFGDAQTGNLVSGGLLAVFITLSALTTFTFTREKPLAETEDKIPAGIFQGLRIAFTNRPFLYVVGIYLLSWLTVQFITANLLLYLRYWFEAEHLFTRLVFILQVTSFSFLAVWSWVSSRLGKKQAYYIGTAIFIPLLIALFFTGQENIAALYVISFIAGICVSMALLLPWSMLPDVVEWDELKTGKRREGVYYGLFVFAQKIGLSLALAISAAVLEVAGYVNPETAGEFVRQPDSVLLALRLSVSIFPAILLVLSIPLAIAYPITRAKFAEMRAQLHQ